MEKNGAGVTFMPTRNRFRNQVSSVSESTASLKSKLFSRLSTRIFSWMSKMSLPSKNESGLAGGGGVTGDLSGGPANAGTALSARAARMWERDLIMFMSGVGFLLCLLHRIQDAAGVSA